jgi:hypothetical protein
MARPKTKKRVAKSVKRKKFLFIPYPLVIFLLLCAGVYLVAWTFNAHADDIIVNAVVKDKPITQPPVIDPTIAGKTYNAVPLDVSGTCPTNAAYVEIFRNGLMTGIAICQNGVFDPAVDLFVGKNILTAEAFNLTDDQGPASSPVIVYYDPPTPQPSLQIPGTATPKNNPLLLKTAFVYKGYYTNQEVVWPLEISGGSSPYALSVDWGDGQTSIISRAQPGQFNITHSYKHSSPTSSHDYTVKVQASDSAGNYTYLQFFLIVNTHNLVGVFGTTNIYSKGPPSLGGLHQWVWAVWPLYLALVLMAISYKLGERQEFLVLRKRHQLRRS